MNAIIDFNQAEIQDLMICAFRYSLGRKTYIPTSIAYLLIKHKDKLTLSSREIIVRDIKRAIETGNYGMACDKFVWKDVSEVLENEPSL